MPRYDEWSPAARMVLILAAVVVLVAGLKAAAGLVVMVLLALFLAVITTPLVVALKKLGLGTGTVLLIMIFGAGMLGLGGGLLILQSLKSLTIDLPNYQYAIYKEILAAVDWLREQGLEIERQDIDEWLKPMAAMQYVGNTLRTATGLLGQSFLIFLLIIFMWLEAAILPEKIERMVEPATWASLNQGVDGVRRYVLLKTVMSLATGLAAGLFCWVMDIQYALLWGVLAFFFNFVPTIGSIVAAIPPFFMALVQDGGGSAAILAIGYTVINVGISNGIEPRFMGRGLGLSPLVVVLSMIIWGWVLGPIGMLLSVPLTTVVKLALEANEDTRWMAVILGGEVPEQRVSIGTRRISEAPVAEGGDIQVSER